MQQWDDVFGYRKLPGWPQGGSRVAEKTIDINAVAKPVSPKWFSIATGFGVCFGLLFVTQLLLAIASHDLKNYRARAVDTGTAASVFVSLAVGVIAWKRFDENS